MDQETPSATSEAPASKQGLYRDVLENWKTGHRLKAALLFLIVSVLFPYGLLRVLLVEKFFWGILFGGIVVTAIVAAGQSWSIGFYPAWKIYKYWWIAAPVYGPAVGFVLGLEVGLIHGIEWLFRRLGKAKYAKISMGAFLALGIAVGILFAGYYGARQDNPMLSSQSANLDALNKAVGDQNRVLGNLSDSAKTLLGQLNATETELENAKKQLSMTLTNFDAQREAAGHVSAELKGIDARQRQIVLQTEELERILEGQRPLTRQDLQRANWQGLIWGFILGFASSLLATIVYSTFKKSKTA